LAAVKFQKKMTALERIQEAKNDKLTYLDLSYMELTKIPPEIAGLENLQELNLSNNQISDLSNLVGLENLQELDLSNNQISDLINLAGLIDLAKYNKYLN
jgi:Leucine-rich repeat (LRR) protein